MVAGDLPQTHSNCCSFVYLNITGVQKCPGKMLLESHGKVLEIFVTKRVGNLAFAAVVL